jgi:hypothetical protein
MEERVGGSEGEGLLRNGRKSGREKQIGGRSVGWNGIAVREGKSDVWDG